MSVEDIKAIRALEDIVKSQVVILLQQREWHFGTLGFVDSRISLLRLLMRTRTEDARLTPEELGEAILEAKI